MPHRTFSDAAGHSWQVWDVTPHGVERRDRSSRRDAAPDDQRSGQDRRHHSERRSGAVRLIARDQRSGERRSVRDRRARHERRSDDTERRGGYDRRSIRRTRVNLPHGFTDGWLCFECLAEKRRLAPVPERWADLPEPELLLLLDQATVVTPRTRQPTVAGRL